jgi:hypothetical protein|tara:strand:- start:2146 stop:2757 length:612 start_codon:yes stop_codon:yes gene_type:complete
MSKYLLREYYELCEGGICQDFLTEGEKRMVNEQGAVFLTGIIQAADQKNGNGRIYPKMILEREVENYRKIIDENRALGELDHPDDSVVNLRNVSHIVTDCWWEGNQVMGKLKALDTPSGNILKSLAQSGVSLGISSRGMGSVHEANGNTIVEDDFQLICFDIVSEPSTTNAYLNLSENRQREIQDEIWTKADRINRALNNILL